MNFADCLQQAVIAGELDPERAKLAQADWADLAKRYEASGYSPADARLAAADEMVERMKNAVQKRRHVTVRQMLTLQRNQARYAQAAIDDPDLLLRDIEAVQSEAQSIFKQAMGGLQEFLADHSEDILGRVRGRAQLSDILRELHLQDSGNSRANTSRAGGGLAETMAGPVVGLAGDVGRAVMSNAARVSEGKTPLIGRDIVNLGRRYNPLATYWPTRVALDRIVGDQVQRLVDPEAEELWRKAEKKQRKDYGNQSWWRRGDPLPARAPDLGNIAGATQ
ncbi:MAG: hypothetical protein QM682_02775 [Paracoccus sp. (in: a-proteobacteria)]|uniref:hypothetical protein n=1 Tax=Paracoccus sp. TaxID=267 RepID=UPI0039E2939F